MTSSPAKRRHGVQPLPRCDGRWPVSRHDAVAELDEDIALVQAELDAADHAAKDALARVEAGDETSPPMIYRASAASANSSTPVCEACAHAGQPRPTIDVCAVSPRSAAKSRHTPPRQAMTWSTRNGRSWTPPLPCASDSTRTTRSSQAGGRSGKGLRRSRAPRRITDSTGTPRPDRPRSATVSPSDYSASPRLRSIRSSAAPWTTRRRSARWASIRHPCRRALASLVTAVPGLPDDATFYLGTGGAVLQFGPNGPDEVTATQLVRELSRAEALAIWDEQAAYPKSRAPAIRPDTFH